jgi:rhamnulose-1-phosphate aldolase/alcohol dehydrogenase
MTVTTTQQYPVADAPDLWGRDAPATGTGELELLAYRSNLLGRDRAVANFGGGNTSVKAREVDHAGRDIDVLWVKGSGTDLATITAGGFTGLRRAEIDPVFERDGMTDEEMVAHLARCQLDPAMPRCSIETLLHAFVPAPHVDHTHPDAINAICGAADGERLARACFGDEIAWIPYIRPGFALSKQIGAAVRDNPGLRAVLMAKHGLVCWGDSAEESYRRTIEVINQAARFVRERAGSPPAAAAPLDEERAEALLAELLPVLRGALAPGGAKVLTVDRSPDVLAFVSRADAAELTQVGAACPDHLVHTKRRPLWIPYEPDADGPEALAARVRERAAAFREAEEAYIDAHAGDAPPDGATSAPLPPDPDFNPRVVLIERLGMVTAGRDRKKSLVSRDLFHRAIVVQRAAATLDRFVSLTDVESFAVEYWPLELYKLSLAPQPGELAGKVALITGAAGGIGRAVADALTAAGALVVATDLQAGDVPGDGLALTMDVTDEAAVRDAFRRATLEFGGVDIVVSSAGLASSAPIEDTTLELWESNYAVLARGYFLVAREAFRLLQAQASGGSIVFVASKNALVAGKAAAAYSSAKAAELHLARCLAEEGGVHGIRVNTVNPDAVLQGSRIWDSTWREERAEAYGIATDDLEEHYRKRTTLGVNVLPADVAQAVLHFASEARSAKSTGNILNVDGGVGAAYPR